jgi:hypothetical protein
MVSATTQSQTEKNTALCRDTERRTSRKKRPIAAQLKRSSEVAPTPARRTPPVFVDSDRCIGIGRLPGSVPGAQRGPAMLGSPRPC